jgi:gliotoxin/aspirochlorine biosynthesis O-methyltransferase
MGNIKYLNASRTAPLTELEAVLQELTLNVRVAVAKLKGPLKSAVRESLHDPNTLPEARCSAIAADVVDVLHEVQQLVEPRTLILADHFLGALGKA